MNVHSSSQPMPQPQIESSNLDRRSQILDAALVCFAKRGFHQASMHDISAEAARNPQVADLVRDVLQTAMDGVTELIARAPETQNATHGLSPTELAELIFAVARGMLMFDVLRPHETTAAERRTRQLEVTRRLWRLLFKPEAELAYA